MIILSIDVGIKNLAYCIIKLNKSNCNDKNSIEIIDWNIVNLCETLNLCEKSRRLRPALGMRKRTHNLPPFFLFLLFSFPSHSQLSFAPLFIEKLQFHMKW